VYKLNPNDWYGNPPKSLKRLSDNAAIPFDPANIDYQKYLQWLSEGNEPTPPDEVTE